MAPKPKADLQNQGIPILINAGAEGEAGVTPADENHAADRWIRSSAGRRAVFAIQGILWMKSAELRC